MTSPRVRYRSFSCRATFGVFQGQEIFSEVHHSVDLTFTRAWWYWWCMEMVEWHFGCSKHLRRRGALMTPYPWSGPGGSSLLVVHDHWGWGWITIDLSAIMSHQGDGTSLSLPRRFERNFGNPKIYQNVSQPFGQLPRHQRLVVILLVSLARVSLVEVFFVVRNGSTGHQAHGWPIILSHGIWSQSTSVEHRYE